MKLLRLWQLPDRFLDSKMKGIAEGGLTRLNLSVDDWKIECENLWDLKQERIAAVFKVVQLGDRLCKQENVPYKDQMVTILANTPPQVFAENVEQLDEDLLMAVTKAFALRWVDCNDSKNGDTEQLPEKGHTRKKRKLIED